MAVLITGGGGYIGSQTVWIFREAGERVVVLDDLSTGFEAAVPAGTDFVRGDIGDQDLIGRLLSRHGIDAIVHFAGSVVVPDSVSNPIAYYENNTTKTLRLVSEAVRHGVKSFIFSSTSAVYGTRGLKPVTEQTELRPQSPYGRSKLMSEWILRDVAQAHPLQYGILRYFNVAGADPAGRSGQATKGATHLIKVATEAALGKRDFIEVFGTDYDTPDGTCVRDYIHVTDLARAHLLTLRHLRDSGSNIVANCGYGHGYSVLDVLSAVERVSGRKLDIRHSARRPGDPAAIVADASFIRRQIGWQPEFDDLDTIVKTALLWEQNRPY